MKLPIEAATKASAWADEAASRRACSHSEASVRFLVEDGWLAHYLDFSQDRYIPPMPKLLDAPFWLDPSDPHRMPTAIQFLTRPRGQNMYAAASYDWRYLLPMWRELVWSKAVHRVAADGISPEQAVDEAITRIKQIQSE